MKKLTLIILLISFLLLNAEVIQIGEGTVLNSHLPIFNRLNYSYSQMIYPASLFDCDSEINAIGFQLYFDPTSPIADPYNNFFLYQNDLVIKLGISQLNCFNGSQWESDAGLTEVFNGIITTADFEFEDGETGWLTVSFDTPFSLQQSQNLVITIDENRDGMTSSFERFLCHSYADSMGIYTGSMTTNIDPSQLPSDSTPLYYETNLPNLRLQINREMPIPENPIPSHDAVDIPVNTHLQWFWNAEECDVYLGDSQTTLSLLADGINSLSVNILDNLNYNTDYYWQVVGYFEEEVRAGPIWSFTTMTIISELFSEDFETYAVYEDIGFPWEAIDGDGALTYGLTDWDFPGESEAHCFISFQPNLLDGFPIGAYTGDKCAVSIASVIPPNDDLIISPMIEVGEASQLTFNASSLTTQYGMERLRVYVYPIGIIEDGIQLNDNSIEVPSEWTAYQFDLSEWEGMPIKLGFQCCSFDALMLLLDNIIVTGTIANDEDVQPVNPLTISVYPNPSKSIVNLAFKLKYPGLTTLSVYDIKGRKIETIYSDILSSGKHTFSWNGLNHHKKQVPSGVYLLRLESNNLKTIKKFIYLK